MVRLGKNYWLFAFALAAIYLRTMPKRKAAAEDAGPSWAFTAVLQHLTELSIEDAGPQSVSQLWFWPSQAVLRLDQAELLDEVVKKLERGVRMTSAYSGLGSAETAMHFIWQAVVRHTGRAIAPVEVMAACDLAKR